MEVRISKELQSVVAPVAVRPSEEPCTSGLGRHRGSLGGWKHDWYLPSRIRRAMGQQLGVRGQGKLLVYSVMSPWVNVLHWPSLRIIMGVNA